MEDNMGAGTRLDIERDKAFRKWWTSEEGRAALAKHSAEIKAEAVRKKQREFGIQTEVDPRFKI